MPATRRLSRLTNRTDSHSNSEAPPAKKPKRTHVGEEFPCPAVRRALIAVLTADDPSPSAIVGRGGIEAPPDAPPRQAKGKGKATAREPQLPDPSTFLKRVDSPWLVGAHVSAAKGVENAVTNAAAIGANSFALFLKSQRKWTSPDLTETSIAEFKKRMKEHRYSSGMVLPHGSYLINLGNPDAEKREKSYICFLDDMKRCEALGLELYNFHPGSTVGQATTEESLAFIAECINRAHKETKGVTAVLENMAGAGNIVGSEFSHLSGIIDRVEDKSRVGVCIDTCHAFAAGFDIRTKQGWEDTMKAFDDTIGLKYLRGMHLNDSKTDHNSKKDRHENIGLGYLGISAFHHILSDPRTQGIPLVLETPSFEQPKEVWGKEIKTLQRISGNAVHLMTDRPSDEGGESGFDDLVVDIKCAVEEAEKKNGGPKAKKPVQSKKAPTKRKRAASMDDEEEDTDEDT